MSFTSIISMLLWLGAAMIFAYCLSRHDRELPLSAIPRFGVIAIVAFSFIRGISALGSTVSLVEMASSAAILLASVTIMLSQGKFLPVPVNQQLSKRKV